MLRIEHIGIAVRDLEKSNRLFEALLGVGPYKEETVESEKVKTSFFQTGQTKLELLESLTDDGPIARYLEKRGEGMHHIAFEVTDIEEEMRRLSALGLRLLNEKPKRGADNKLVCFLHPKDTNGVLVELCQTLPASETSGNKG